MADFFELWKGGPVFAQAEHFRLGTDSILLASFAGHCSAKNGIDLGCGSGAIGLLLLTENERLHMTGIELLPEAADMARENLEQNCLSGRGTVVTGDMRRHRNLFRTGAFDLVVANPPYFSLGSGAVSPIPGRAGARGEMNCTLEDVCTAASFLCRTGGSVCLVYRPERLPELFSCMKAHGIEPKRMRVVCDSPQALPSLVLVEGRRGGKPGLMMESCLFLRNPDGTESAEIRRIYHRG